MTEPAASAVFTHFSYFVTVFLMVAGLFIVIARGNLIKKLVGLGIFQTSVYLLYIAPGKVIGGFWFQSPDHPWSRITTVDLPELERMESPCGPVWQPIHPEAILLPLYGAGWRIPDPDFDTIIAACSLRGFSVMTQSYAFARIYGTWLLGQTRKTRALVGHTLRHLPEDEWLLAAAQLLGQEDVSPAALLP